MKLKYIVTGTGRCGTVYMARLLTSVGIPCGHEMIFDYRGLHYAKKRLAGEMPLELSWVSRAKYDKGEWNEFEPWLDDRHAVVAESSYMAAPFLGDKWFDDSKIIHIVRDPVKVINSFCNYIDFFKDSTESNSYEAFIYNQLPELRSQMPQYDRACLFYVLWTSMIDSHDVFLHRVEDGPALVLELLSKEGPCFSDKNINSLKRTTWERFSPHKIESGEIRDRFIVMGKRYGYSMRSEYLLM